MTFLCSICVWLNKKFGNNYPDGGYSKFGDELVSLDDRIKKLVNEKSNEKAFSLTQCFESLCKYIEKNADYGVYRIPKKNDKDVHKVLTWLEKGEIPEKKIWDVHACTFIIKRMVHVLPNMKTFGDSLKDKDVSKQEDFEFVSKKLGKDTFMVFQIFLEHLRKLLLIEDLTGMDLKSLANSIAPNLYSNSYSNLEDSIQKTKHVSTQIQKLILGSEKYQSKSFKDVAVRLDQ